MRIGSRRPRALITGIWGQDGWYLSRLLLERGYDVIGTSHRMAARPLHHPGIGTAHVVHLELTDGPAIKALIAEGQFDEIYNLAAIASSSLRFRNPGELSMINGVAVAHMLDAVHATSRGTRFCQASSSEVFAGTRASPQNESTVRSPNSPYGAAKLYADNLVGIYRDHFDLFACSAILYSHESPRRPPTHIVRKITRAVALIAAGGVDSVSLGNLAAVRDWGHASDYVDAMHRMLTFHVPKDYIVATGIPHTVADVCDIAFHSVSLRPEDHIVLDSTLHTEEPAPRVGNPSNARADLSWTATRDLASIVIEMLAADRLSVAQELNHS